MPQTSQDEQIPDPSSSTPESDEDINDPESQVDVAKLCQEGGVALINYLLSKAIPPFEPPKESNIREWTFCDIACLPKTEQKEWQKACEEELEALHWCKVFEIVDRPKGTNIVKNHWVFDIKSDGQKKARLVTKGFSQIEDLDFNQIFSPVVRFETVRLILALAVLNKWHIQAVDVYNAYLYGKLDEEIYIEQPEGFHVKG